MLRTSLAIVAVVVAAPHAGQTKPITLDTALARAKSRPAAAAATSRAAAARHSATAERRAATLPTVSVYATPSWRDRTLTLATPLGRFPVGDQLTTVAGIRISQPILDATRLFYTSAAARDDARAAADIALRTKQQLAGEAAERFFDVLVIEARIAVVEAFVASLDARAREIEAMVAAGRAVDADALRVRLTVDDARQDLLVLREAREVARLALGRAVGFDEPASPVFDADAVPRAPRPDPAAAADAALSRRRDLRALEWRAAATAHRRQGVWSELIPRVELQGDAMYSDAGPQAEPQLLSVTVSLVWTPLASGTRAARARAFERERIALANDYTEAARGVRVQTRQALADVRIANGELAVATTAVDQAQEAARVTAERYRAGREQVQAVLDTEAVLRDRRARKSVAQIELARARIRVAVATGQL